ncbi:hypothetical protein LUI11_37005 [Bradyrhizobium diazoefficiens]|uniref:Uncharacterized protein n=2 Tax=Bradyrhizobium diazoefficiens TaxID=1355477 RepID=A0A837CGM0_9BRAD|nr:hypothetical protein [Bradyrhizobium diazoefficiens]APO55342.1 hypothetical protein BD122_33700 [Bradyrhizobium diazoefficiens]KGJ68165.1 hypothetical protein BJA5080_00937 [Bradyrhizobium diazoefficiens SEMIA 5080]MCD9298012.1 hypothetical protein [Bradyrhizobium diazoefficiens]MCD9815523.1 hypothetical protein [Bradyrhizobium diazoefficiens]MCD9833451.1 hypothetical protein [Bradyrhizobium diazoefficiens]
MDIPAVPSSPADPSPVSVRVLTRVVAAGVVKRNGKYRLRASLAFLPQPASAEEIREDQNKPKSEQQLVDLTKWPSEIEKRFPGGGAVKLNVAKIAKDGDRILPIAGDTGKTTTWTRTTPARDMTYLVSLWRRLLAPTVEIGDLVFDPPNAKPEDKSATNDSRRVLETYWDQYVDATAAFVDPWGHLCAALRQSIAGSAAQKIVETKYPVQVSTVPYAEVSAALSAFSMQAATETVATGVRHSAREQVKFVLEARRMGGAMTKLGRLAAGPVPRRDGGDAMTMAAEYAAARRPLVDARDFQLSANKKGRSERNVRVAVQAEQAFLRRHRGDQSVAETGELSFSWQGQARSKKRWRYADVFNDFAFVNTLTASMNATSVRPTITQLGRKALHTFATRSSEALLQHFWAMRVVPQELTPQQKEDVAKAVSKQAEKSRDPRDLRKARADREANWRRYDRAARQIVDAPARRFFGLQSFPTLARVFNLVVDVEIELKDFNDSLSAIPGTDWLYRDEEAVDFDAEDIDRYGSGPRTARSDFLLLAHLPTGQTGDQALWSIVKLRQNGATDRDDAHFWPVTFEEIEIVRDLFRLEKVIADSTKTEAEKQKAREQKEEAETTRPPQFDGIVDLGFQQDGKPRFELDNRDFAQSLEQYANAAEGAQAAEEGGAPLDRHGQGLGTLRTGGLVLLDRMRPDLVVTNAQSSLSQVKQRATNQGVVLDAQMLTVGYRLDIGVWPSDRQSERFVWRSLMNRIVNFADPADSADTIEQGKLERHIRELNLSVEERIRLDSGLVRTPSKMIALDKNKNPDKAEAIANQDIAVWTGDPLGLECGGADERTSTVEVDPTRDLPLTIVYDLPRDLGTTKGDREAYAPPRLEFGRGYRVGLRSVYLGGVTLPLERAAARYEKAKDGTLTLPPRDSNGHRFLRSEPIDPPLLTMSERVHKAHRHPDQPWDSTEWAVVRTGSDPRLKPESTARVVIPPAVPMEYAVLHRIKTWSRTVGNERGHGLRLVDGLVNVSLDPNWGGFPSLDDKRRNPTFQPRFEDRPKNPSMVYDAVFQVKTTSDEDLALRKQPYYPDPGARRLAVEVVTRRPDAERKEAPLVVPLDAPGHEVRYPDYVPVLIEVIAIKADATRKSIVDSDPETDVGVLQPGGNFVKQSWRGWRPSSGTVRVRRVRVHLRPGEDYDVRMWCPPPSDDIARWFQAGEDFVHYQHMLGTIENRLSSTSELGVRALRAIGLDHNTRSDELTIVQGMLAIMGDAEAKSFVGALEKRDASNALPAFEGVVNPDGVSAKLFRLIAEYLGQRGREVAVPGFAKMRTMRVTHATQQPRFEPCFIGLGAEPPACMKTQDGDKLIAIVRKEFDETSGVGLAGAPGATGDDKKRPGWLLNHPDPTKWITLPHAGHDDGAADTVFGGRVAMDLDTSSQLTLWGTVATVNDDIKRKRDRSKRLPEPSPPQSLAGSVPDEPFNIYGFSVDKEGKVTFPKQRIELLRTRDLSAEIHAQKVDDLVEKPEILDLAFTPDGAVREYERRHRFTTPQAVKLSLELEARSRFEHMLLRQPDHNEPPPTPPDPITRRGAKAEIWLPATKSPDPLDRKSLLPAFVWTEKFDGTEIERRTKIRIRWKRPGICGEDEKLAIVLWPPEIVDPGRRDEIARDIARDLVKSQGGVTAYKEYEDFEDNDLGPGGQFITRWASDAIRRGPVQNGFFMPLEAFRDALPDFGGNTNAQLVPSVQMPIPRGDNDDDSTVPIGGASKSSSPLLQNTMLVSLLAYEPRFDIADESWYVDAEISPLVLAYPFLRLGLVRYQKHAPPEWQVSEPIPEFIQILPRRHVVVSAETVGSHGYPVRVDIFGSASDLVALNPEDEKDAGTKADAMHRPVLKALVLRHPDGVAYGGDARDNMVPEVIATGIDGRLLKWNSADDPTAVQPRRDEPGLEWSFRFVLKDDPRNIPHFIFMEEVDWMLPTDPDAEGVRQGRDPGSDSIVAESGPRFALKLRIRS